MSDETKPVGKATAAVAKRRGTAPEILAVYDASGNDKARTAFILRRRGYSTALIAETLGVTSEHVSNLIQEFSKAQGDALSDSTALELLAGELAEIQEQINRLQRVLAGLYAKAKTDSAGNLLLTDRLHNAAMKTERIVAQLNEQRTALLLKVGLIPAAPEKHALISRLSAEIETREGNRGDDLDGLSADELKLKLIESMQRARWIPSI